MNALVTGLIVGLFIVWLLKAVVIPGPRKIQAIVRLKKLRKIIANVEGKKISKDSITNGVKKWELIDGLNKNKFNIYLIAWPFDKLHHYPLNYTKTRKRGEEQPGDVIIADDEESTEILVSRSGISDYLEFRGEYPSVTKNLETKGLGSVNLYSTDIIEIKNGALALFGIENWFRATMEILAEARKTIISEKELHEVNELSQENDFFNTEMKDLTSDKLAKIGVVLFQSIYKDYEPANEETQKLMDATLSVAIAEKTGDARIIEAKKNAKAEVATAEGKTKAFEKFENKVIELDKKKRVETGQAKVDAAGKITELIPEANVKIKADAIGKLKDLKGTLILGQDESQVIIDNTSKE